MNSSFTMQFGDLMIDSDLGVSTVHSSAMYWTVAHDQESRMQSCCAPNKFMVSAPASCLLLLAHILVEDIAPKCSPSQEVCNIHCLFSPHQQSIWESYIRHKDFLHLDSVRQSVMLILPPLDSETGWTGELWSNRVVPILENCLRGQHFFSGKFVFFF